MKHKQSFLLAVFTLLVLLSACGTASKENLPDFTGDYSFGDSYGVEIGKNEGDSSQNMYWFVVKFNISENDYVSGEMNIGEPYSFDGTNSIDNGKLTFSYEDNKLYLAFNSELHGSFKEALIVQEKINYTDLDLNLYCKEYYSPTELYGISLMPDEESNGFYVDLNYDDGLHDEGVVVPGEETTLVNGATITLYPEANGEMRIALYSAISAYGNYEENLIEGSLFDIIGITPSMLC